MSYAAPPVLTGPTAHLDPATLAEARALMDVAFDDFTDHDWEHALGGEHAYVRDPATTGPVVAHAALVPRRITVAGTPLRAGYVEAVAVAPSHHRRGLGAAVMAPIEARAATYDLLALSASSIAVPFYLARDWLLWRGPSSVEPVEPTSSGEPVPTPEDDGAIYVWPVAPGLAGALDLDASITCDHRDGDVW